MYFLLLLFFLLSATIWATDEHTHRSTFKKKYHTKRRNLSKSLKCHENLTVESIQKIAATTRTSCIYFAGTATLLPLLLLLLLLLLLFIGVRWLDFQHYLYHWSKHNQKKTLYVICLLACLVGWLVDCLVSGILLLLPFLLFHNFFLFRFVYSVPPSNVSVFSKKVQVLLCVWVCVCVLSTIHTCIIYKSDDWSCLIQSIFFSAISKKWFEKYMFVYICVVYI